MCTLVGAGQGPYPLNFPCWSAFPCNEPFYAYCYLGGDFADLEVPYEAPSVTFNMATTVSVPGGGPYRLSYTLSLEVLAHFQSFWMTTIASTDGSFLPIVLESFSNSDGVIYPSQRELGFSLPSGTSILRLNFTGTPVRACKPAMF